MSRTSKGKELLRIGRRAAVSSTSTPKISVAVGVRSYYAAPTASTPCSSAFVFDPALKPHHQQPIYALAPYPDYAFLPFSSSSDALAIASCQPSTTASGSNPFLPLSHAQSVDGSRASEPSGLLGSSARRSEHKPATLCFRQNGASGIPKGDTSHRRHARDLPGFTNPHAEVVARIHARGLKSVQVGEDAYFIRSDAMGVADGVGAWSRKQNADPALFSRLLMHYCAVGLERYDDIDDPLFLDYYHVDPIEVVAEASILTIDEANQCGFAGSSTALIAVLRSDVLRVANLGDCNCTIIRGTEFLFRSEEQQHMFNYPMQIGTKSKDTAKKDGQRFDVKVQKDDIVILSSDGLTDNLFEEDILEEVLRFSHPNYDPLVDHPPLGKQATFSPQDVSDALSSRARAVIDDELAAASPFQQRANQEGMYYTGGKPDDITVIVAVIDEELDSADRR